MKKDKQYWHDFIRDMPAAEFQELFWAALEWQARLTNLYEGMKMRETETMSDSISNEMKRITR